MNTTSVLLAAQQATDTGPDLTPLLTLIGSAGIATIVVNIVKGLWVNSQVRGPRARVQAIRDGAETLALLTPGSAPYLAVEKQVLAEAEMLAAPRRPWWSWVAMVVAGPGLIDITITSDAIAAALGMWDIETATDGSSGRTSKSARRDALAKSRRLARYGTWAFIIAPVVLVFTVISFFTPWTSGTQTTVAAVGGALIVVLLSVGSALHQVSSVMSQAADSARPEADDDDDLHESGRLATRS